MCHYGDMMAEGAAGSCYLGDAQLAGGQLSLCLSHLLGALSLGALQLFAALHHCLHLRLHFTDVESSYGELFIDVTTALLLLRRQKHSYFPVLEWIRSCYDCQTSVTKTLTFFKFLFLFHVSHAEHVTCEM